MLLTHFFLKIKLNETCMSTLALHAKSVTMFSSGMVFSF